MISMLPVLIALLSLPSLSLHAGHAASCPVPASRTYDGRPGMAPCAVAYPHALDYRTWHLGAGKGE